MDKLVPIYISGYIDKKEADNQFDRLWNTLDWERRDDAPRIEYWQNNFNLPYTYGRGAGERTYHAKPWDEFVKGTMERINSEFGFDMNCCFMNGYETSRHSLGWHADNSPEMNHDEPILSLSLGGERYIEYRNNDDMVSNKVLLEHGSLFIMPAGFQRNHSHRIPKAGFIVPPRISLTYRNMFV